MKKFYKKPYYYGLAGTLVGEKDVDIEAYREQFESRGFDNTELWNLDDTLAKIILPRLKKFRKINKGYPMSFGSLKKWNKTLDKMIYAFKEIVNGGFIVCEEERKERQKSIDEGLGLFAKHFQSLWM